MLVIYARLLNMSIKNTGQQPMAYNSDLPTKPLNLAPKAEALVVFSNRGFATLHHTGLCTL